MNIYKVAAELGQRRKVSNTRSSTPGLCYVSGPQLVYVLHANGLPIGLKVVRRVIRLWDQYHKGKGSAKNREPVVPLSRLVNFLLYLEFFPVDVLQEAGNGKEVNLLACAKMLDKNQSVARFDTLSENHAEQEVKEILDAHGFEMLGHTYAEPFVFDLD